MKPGQTIRIVTCENAALFAKDRKGSAYLDDIVLTLR